MEKKKRTANSLGEKAEKVLDIICEYAEFIVLGMGIILIILALIISKQKEKVLVIYEESPMNEIVEYGEMPNEPELIRLAIIDTIGTDKEEETFGYDFTRLVGIIYHESGGNYELAKKIATCVLNAQKLSGCTLSPIDVCEQYNYTYDMGYYGSKTLKACIEVFLDGDVDEEVQGATLFYNPRFTDGTPMHESKKYICSYYDDRYGEIRFFEE